MLGQEARRLPPAARSVLSDTIDNFRRRLVETLTELGRPSPSTLADSVVAELIGAMTLARAMDDEESAMRLLAASRLELKRRAGLVPGTRASESRELALVIYRATHRGERATRHPRAGGGGGPAEST